jgi:hypothetical protein
MIKKLLVLAATIAMCESAHAQILLSNFSNLSSQAFTPFNLTWDYSPDGGVTEIDQFAQNAGNVSVTPEGAGSPGPTGTGSFDSVFQGSDMNSPTSVSFLGIGSLVLTARLDAGNADTAFNVEVEDGSFNEIGSATFLASSFNSSSFSPVTAAFVLNGSGMITDATYFTLGGDLTSNQVRISLDNLQATASPEPPSVALLILGMAAIGLYRYRPRLL